MYARLDLLVNRSSRESKRITNNALSPTLSSDDTWVRAVDTASIHSGKVHSDSNAAVPHNYYCLHFRYMSPIIRT